MAKFKVGDAVKNNVTGHLGLVAEVYAQGKGPHPIYRIRTNRGYDYCADEEALAFYHPKSDKATFDSWARADREIIEKVREILGLREGFSIEEVRLLREKLDRYDRVDMCAVAGFWKDVYGVGAHVVARFKAPSGLSEWKDGYQHGMLAAMMSISEAMKISEKEEGKRDA